MIPFNRDIPNGPDDPSNDQPLMKDNTNSEDDIWTVDHFGFNVSSNNSGRHKQLTLTSEAAPGFSGGDAVLFSLNSNGSDWPAWQNSAGINLLINSNTLNASNGYAALPAGVLMQWGIKTGMVQGSFPVTFPIDFSTAAYSVILQPIRISTTDKDSLYVLTGSVNSSGFTIVNTSNSIDSAYWIAIGAV